MRPHCTDLLEFQRTGAEEHAKAVAPLVPIPMNVDHKFVLENLGRVHLHTPAPSAYGGLERQSLLVGKEGPLMQSAPRHPHRLHVKEIGTPRRQAAQPTPRVHCPLIHRPAPVHPRPALLPRRPHVALSALSAPTRPNVVCQVARRLVPRVRHALWLRLPVPEEQIRDENVHVRCAAGRCKHGLVPPAQQLWEDGRAAGGRGRAGSKREQDRRVTGQKVGRTAAPMEGMIDGDSVSKTHHACVRTASFAHSMQVWMHAVYTHLCTQMQVRLLQGIK